MEEDSYLLTTSGGSADDIWYQSGGVRMAQAHNIGVVKY